MNNMLIISFILFSGLVALITFFKTRGQVEESSEGYFLGGRSLTWKVISTSLILTNLSAVSFIGMSAQAYQSNISVMGWEVGSGITLVLVAVFLLPRYLKQGITTIPEFIEARFDSGTKKFVTILFLVSYIVNLLPITLYSGAVAMSELFNVSGLLGVTYAQGIWITVWFIGIVGSIYAIFGGLKVVATADTLNGIALVIGGLLVPLFALIFMGDGNLIEGVQVFLNSTPEKFNSIGSNSDSLPFSTMFTGLLLVNLYYWGTDQSIIQKGLGAKNLKEGQKGIIAAGLLKVLTPMIIIIPGIMAFQIIGPNAANADTVYPQLVGLVLPKPLAGFFAAAMMGAILSTFNGVLNSASTLFALDIYKAKWGQGKSDKQLVKAGKIFGAVIAFIAMCCAPFIMFAPNGLFDYLQTINGFFNVPIFTIIFMGYMTKKVPPIAAKVGITFFVTCYAISQLVLDLPIHYLHVSAILFVLSCTIMFLIGKKHPAKEAFVLMDNKLVDIEPWENRFKASGFVIFLMVSMYIVFSKLGLADVSGFRMTTVIALAVNAGICIALVLLVERFAKEK